MLLGVGSLSMAGSVTAQQAPASEKGEVPTPSEYPFLVVDDLKPNIGPLRRPDRPNAGIRPYRGVGG